MMVLSSCRQISNPLITRSRNMGALDRILSLTLGRVIPKYMTCADWSVEYLQVIGLRPLAESTLHNRKASTKHIVAGIGHLPIGSVKPIHVGKMIRDIAQRSPQCAKRALFEARDFFNEAILAGVIDSNPATPIKPPAVKIQRHRLTFEQWQQIRAWSVANQPPWVARICTSSNSRPAHAWPCRWRCIWMCWARASPM